MKISIFQVDAFADKVFSGNPAAVCPLDSWLEDKILQHIAAENNLAETAFFVKTGEDFHIRWFTPKAEVDLCGHATLAAAFVLLECLGYEKDSISFQSRSGLLTVSKNNSWLTLNFPADRTTQIDISPMLSSCFDKIPIEAWKGLTDFMLVFESQEDIESIQPDLQEIASLKARGIIVTAAGNDCDFVSRFFAPAVGINEDPVTGSAHTTLTPYWSRRLNKTALTARQLSERGGYLKCELLQDGRVEISGQAALYMKGEIFI
jgi:PhzF family phenazine biosynthesis protein